MSVLYAFGDLLCHALTAVIERLVDHSARNTTQDDSSPQLRDDFQEHDPEDTIFEEFESPRRSSDPSGWKEARPSFKSSLLKCAWFSFRITVVVGGFVGLGTLLITYLLIETVSKCRWKTLNDPSYPVEVKRGYIFGDSLLAVLLYFWNPLLFMMVFKWSLIKDSNLLCYAMTGATIDLGYRFFCQLYDLYRPPWIPYPSVIFYIAVVIVGSLTVSRTLIKTSSFHSTVLTFKLCAQFITTAPLLYIAMFAVVPWFSRQIGFWKIAIPFVVFVVCLPSRLITRLCVTTLDGINHPGTSHVLSSLLIGAFPIIYRLLQAEFKILYMFILLSIGHGLVLLGYELTGRLRELSWEKLLCVDAEVHDSQDRSHGIRNTPRSQRLAADMAIQDMMFDSTALVLSVGIIQVYGFIYSTLTPGKAEEMVTELLIRIFIGWFFQVFFNTLSILLHTRSRNIPILRVWELKWKSHLMLCILNSIMIMSSSTNYLLQLIRARYSEEEQLSDDCTTPFH